MVIFKDRINKTKATKNEEISTNKYSCKECGSSQTSISEDDSYVCFECGFKSYNSIAPNEMWVRASGGFGNREIFRAPIRIVF